MCGKFFFWEKNNYMLIQKIKTAFVSNLEKQVTAIQVNPVLLSPDNLLMMARIDTLYRC